MTVIREYYNYKEKNEGGSTTIQMYVSSSENQ
jgi:hypothetical protein